MNSLVCFILVIDKYEQSGDISISLSNILSVYFFLLRIDRAPSLLKILIKIQHTYTKLHKPLAYSSMHFPVRTHPCNAPRNRTFQHQEMFLLAPLPFSYWPPPAQGQSLSQLLTLWINFSCFELYPKVNHTAHIILYLAFSWLFNVFVRFIHIHACSCNFCLTSHH